MIATTLGAAKVSLEANFFPCCCCPFPEELLQIRMQLVGVAEAEAISEVTAEEVPFPLLSTSRREITFPSGGEVVSSSEGEEEKLDVFWLILLSGVSDAAWRDRLWLILAVTWTGRLLLRLFFEDDCIELMALLLYYHAMPLLLLLSISAMMDDCAFAAAVRMPIVMQQHLHNLSSFLTFLRSAAALKQKKTESDMSN